MELKTALIMVHLIGLALGVGAATLLDLLIMRFMVFGKISREHVGIVHISAQVVTVGLILLWASGIGFLAYYYFYNPTNLTNQKIYAKMAIVLALTINGHLIHHYVLPLIKQNVGRRLFNGITDRQRMVMLTAGVVSVTSWYIPLALGVLRELNFTSGMNILMVYVLLLMAGISMAQLAGYVTTKPTVLHRIPVVNRLALARLLARPVVRVNRPALIRSHGRSELRPESRTPRLRAMN